MALDVRLPPLHPKAAAQLQFMTVGHGSLFAGNLRALPSHLVVVDSDIHSLQLACHAPVLSHSCAHWDSERHMWPPTGRYGPGNSLVMTVGLQPCEEEQGMSAQFSKRVRMCRAYQKRGCAAMGLC